MTGEATDPEVRVGRKHARKSQCQSTELWEQAKHQYLDRLLTEGSFGDDVALRTRCHELDGNQMGGPLHEEAKRHTQTSSNTKSYQTIISVRNIIFLRVDTDSILLLVLIIILVRLKVQRIAIVELLILATLLGSLVR